MIYTDEFILNGKKIFYIDVSKLVSNDEIINAFELIKQKIEKYDENSLYTITNIEFVMFDTKTIETAAKYMGYNKPYVKYGVIIGFDGIKKAIVKSILKKCNRNNIGFAFTKEQAIELLLHQK